MLHFGVDCFMNLSQCNVGFAVRLLLKNGVAHVVTIFEVIKYFILEVSYFTCEEGIYGKF